MKQRIGAFEQLVLLSVMRLSDGAYGMAIRRDIVECTGRRVSLGAVYATLDRLETKGYLASFEPAGSAGRPGRGRRFFRIRSSGHEALEASVNDLKRMAHGLELQWD